MDNADVELFSLLIENDLELAKLTEQNTNRNRNIPVLNGDFVGTTNNRNKGRVSFSENSILIPYSLDDLDIAEFRFATVPTGLPIDIRFDVHQPTIEEEAEDLSINVTSLGLQSVEAEMFEPSKGSSEESIDCSEVAMQDTEEIMRDEPLCTAEDVERYRCYYGGPGEEDEESSLSDF